LAAGYLTKKILAISKLAVCNHTAARSSFFQSISVFGVFAASLRLIGNNK
jgi:hypothetical protein